MQKSIYCCCVLVLIMASQCFSQRIQKNTNPLHVSSQSIHVHFDKDVYLPGEMIWFKAYLYAAVENKMLATNFYAAIYDEEGNLIEEKLYPIIAGSANGNFQIPDTISTARIQFRAFTKAMIINDTNNVYTNIIAVYKKQDISREITQAPIKKIQFYPEGGQMVAALENQVYFKASYNDGSEAVINGQIIEKETSRVVDTFFTDNLGKGKLTFIPYPNKSYMAVWKNDYGNLVQTSLPAAVRFGVTFHAELVDKEIHYSVVKNKNSDTLSNLHLVAQMNNYKLYYADLFVQNEMEFSEGQFSINNLPDGLLQLTLYNDLWQPLQQRSILINTGATTSLPQITLAKIDTKGKGKNIIEIALTDTTLTNLSVSIADVNFYNGKNKRSFNSDLLFNNQLSDVSENVDSLLKNNNNAAIDTILLTHLWKEHDYKDLQVKSTAPPSVVDNYITLTAFTDKKDISVPQNDTLNMMMMTKYAEKQFYSFNRINAHTFKISNLIFYDSVRANCRLQNNKDLSAYFIAKKQNDVSVPLHIAALPPVVNIDLSFKHIDTFFITKHITFNDVQTIDEVVVKTKKRIVAPRTRLQELDDEYATGFFRGNTKATQFNLLDDTTGVLASTDLQQYLRSRIPGLVVSLKTGNLCIPVPTLAGMTLVPVPVFIDENLIELDFGSQLSNLSTNNFAYIKYIEGIVIGSSIRSTVGAIYIYTKKGNEKWPAAKGLSFNYLKGYNSSPQFTGPDYSDKTLLNTADKRPTLYWNPNIILNKENNKVKIDFYNNDISKKILLTIEGVNANGKIIDIKKVIE